MRDQAIEMLVSYLKKRTVSILKRPPSEVTGCIALLADEDWENKISYKLDTAIQSLQITFMRAKKPGHAFLTAALNQIGSSVMRDTPDLPLKVRITIGSLFIEALYNCGYVNLYRVPMGFKKVDEGKKFVDTPHIVSINPFWSHLAPIDSILERVDLKSTTQDLPKSTRTLTRTIGNYTGPVVKRAKSDFIIDQESEWVQALDKMQQTPLRINGKVLKAIQDNNDLFFNEEPTDPDLKMAFNSKKLAHTYALSKALKVKDWDCFYQGMDVDYRGRYYTIEPFLSYQGQDSSRGLFKFAHGKPMTEAGLGWLAIHTAASFNQTFHKDEIPDWCEEDYKAHLEKQELEDISVDKMSLADKVEWTNQNMDLIVSLGDSVSFSVDSNGSLNAESPVVFLSTCVEWSDYFKSIDNNESVFISHLPIPIDGSNNGWQHLGAMAKDEHTGELVGLIPSSIPKDFYVSTGKKLIELTKSDTEEGKILSKMPMKKVRKQISKRGSMTRAYSAGSGTIGENMWSDVKQNNGHIDFFQFQERKEEFKFLIVEELKKEAADNDTEYKSIPDKELDKRASELAVDHCKDICIKLSKTLVKAIKSTCPGPLDTMKFLQELVKYELGEYGSFKDGEDKTSERKSISAERKEIFKIKDKTDEQLERLNELTLQLSEYEYKLIEGSGNGSRYITWVTPSGFPVKYESYLANKGAVFAPIKGYLKSSGVNLVVNVKTDRPSKRDFASGTSPNIVHSYDSAHLAKVCINHKGSFIGIHDSFSTHASDVDDLLEVTKRTFIDMYHGRDVLNEIKEQILSDDTHFKIPTPTPGNLDILKVMDSTSFFG